jgi:hypothetical protein
LELGCGLLAQGMLFMQPRRFACVAGRPYPAFNGHSGQVENFRLLALGGYADAIARVQAHMLPGVTAQTACEKCHLLGETRDEDGQTLHRTCFNGYLKDAPTESFSLETLDWTSGTICYHQAGEGNGVFDMEAAKAILVLDAKHSIRASAADEASADARAEYPVPAAALDPANVGKAPNSPEQMRLSKGKQPTASTPLLSSPVRAA